MNMTERVGLDPLVEGDGQEKGGGRQQQQAVESYSHHSYPSLCPSFPLPLPFLPSALLSFPSPPPLPSPPNLLMLPLSLKCFNFNLNLNGSTGMNGSSLFERYRKRLRKGEFARDWEREEGDSIPGVGMSPLEGDP